MVALEPGSGKGGVSAWGSAFNLACSAIGAGVLSFPYAFELTGARRT